LVDFPFGCFFVTAFLQLFASFQCCALRFFSALLCHHYVDDRFRSERMTKPMILNVRVGGALSEFVAANVGEHGAYDNVSEYVRDLIRKDKMEAEEQAFQRLKTELQRAFGRADTDYRRITAADVVTRNRARSSPA
jgi:putative addiction module CopG family antidote